MKLRHQLVTLSLGLSLLLILILGCLLALFMRHLLENNLKEKGSDLARVLAADSRVVQALEKGSDPGLRDYVQGICSRTDAAYMVVTDEHARRLSHPSPELVGQTFRGRTSGLHSSRARATVPGTWAPWAPPSAASLPWWGPMARPSARWRWVI